MEEPAKIIEEKFPKIWNMWVCSKLEMPLKEMLETSMTFFFDFKLNLK